MTLNSRLLEEYLSPLSLSVQVFPEVPSTNTTAWELFSGGDRPLLVIAEQQSQGRGQWGRRWESPAGGLYLSLCFDTTLYEPGIYPLVFAAASGIAIELRDQGVKVGVKWPNDLILKGKKLGGVKIETRRAHAVIGVGINWLNPVPETGINLMGYKHVSSLEKLAAMTVKGVLHCYDYYLCKGIEELLETYTNLWIHDGQTVTVNGRPGTIVGVTGEGNLRVRLRSENASAVVSCPPGTVSLGYDLDRD